MLRRLLLFLAAVVVFACPVRATDITLSSFTVESSQMTGSTVTLRIWYSRTFVDSLNNVVAGGTAGTSSAFYKSVTCTNNTTTRVITCPSIVFRSTLDSSDPSVTVTGIFYDSSGAKRQTLFSNWQIPATMGTTLAFTTLNAYNSAPPAYPRPGYPTTDQVGQMIAAQIPLAVVLPTSPQMSPSTGARVVYANHYLPESTDVGAKINAADTALGSNKGLIIYLGGGQVTNRIDLSENHTLYLGAGTYTNVGFDAMITMQSNTQLYGDGSSTILVENSRTLTDGRELIVITQRWTYNDNGATARNIIIRDLQILGSNAAAASTYATINLGNTHHARVSNVFFNGTRTIGLNAGAHPSSGADPLGLGRYAEDVIFEKNTFYKVASQNISFVNVKNGTIKDNIFLQPSRAGLGLNSVVIDCEVNAVGDKMENIQILNNILDARGSDVVPHGNFINFQPASTNTGPARISGNMAYSLFGGSQYTSNGIALGGGSTDVEISNNYLQGMGQNGLQLRGIRLNVFGNTLIDTGQVGGNSSISMEGVTYSKIHSNVLWSPTFLNDLIVETTACDFNQIFNNYNKNAPTLTGANSRAWNNFDRATGIVNTDISVTTSLPTVLQPGSTSGGVTVKSQAAAGTWTFKWPNSAGTSGQVMQTDGTGVASWANVSRMLQGHSNTGTGVVASSTNYLFVGQLLVGATEAERQTTIPFACTFRNLYVTTSNAQPGDGALVLTIRKNGADTGLTLTINAGAAAGTFSNTVNSVSFAAGDKLSLKGVNASASTSALLIAVSVQQDTP